jgi:hypothetical protein
MSPPAANTPPSALIFARMLCAPTLVGQGGPVTPMPIGPTDLGGAVPNVRCLEIMLGSRGKRNQND